jgi:hypothetical protein
MQCRNLRECCLSAAFSLFWCIVRRNMARPRKWPEKMDKHKNLEKEKKR